MDVDITLENYRCFSQQHPAKIEMRPGLTAFVGPNNSGKSSLLRFFYEFRPFFQTIAGNWRGLVVGKNIAPINLPPGVLDFQELFSFNNSNDIRVQIAPGEGPLVTYPPRISLPRGNFGSAMRMELVGGQPIGQGPDGVNFSGTMLSDANFRDVFDDLVNTVYLGAFRNAINTGENYQAYFDVPVGQSFIKHWSQWKTGNVKSLNNAAAQVRADISRIFSFKSFDVSAAFGDERLSFEIDGRPLKDHEVGSGLTQILIVLATVATRQPAYILIDEPELNLHPSLQVKFLMALASYARNGVLFATHSMGLARSVADRIFSVRQVQSGQTEIRKLSETDSLAELLGEMSFSAYREMGFEKILLVEGRSEVKIFQQFLRLFNKDHKIVAVPLNGSSMICPNAEHELSEIRRLCDSIYAVVDSERTAESSEIDPQRRGFQQICEKLGIRCKILDRRATENYFSTESLAKAFPKHSYQQLGPFDRLGTANAGWPKTEGWRAAAEMTKQELLDTDLGGFLEAI